MTHAEIREKYQDHSIADEIVALKEAIENEHERSKVIRNHPDCPSLKQYLVFCEEVESDEQDTILESLFENVSNGSEKKSSRKKEAQHVQLIRVKFN